MGLVSNNSTGHTPFVPPERGNTAAVVVTYNPDAGLRERLLRVQKQVDRVVIVDNASEIGARSRVDEARTLGLEVLENDANLGLARGLNQGVGCAAEHGYAWALTLDQDSIVDEGMLLGLRGVFDAYPRPEHIGLIAANARSPKYGTVLVPCPSATMAYLKVKTIITSGSLFSVPAYRLAGAFRDDFFVEGIDLEYCFRLRRAGFHIVLSCQPLMTHAAGRMEERRLLGRPIVVPNHAPWRYYYNAFNLGRVLRTYGRMDPAWSGGALVNLVKSAIKVVLYERAVGEKLMLLCAGLWDAFVSPERAPRILPGGGRR